jgi:intein-encoded DNA endonuclease-like protein
MGKGVAIELKLLDDDHIRARISWREQDTGGGTLVIEVTVRNMKAAPKTEDELKADARALAVRFARAFADTIEA